MKLPRSPGCEQLIDHHGASFARDHLHLYREARRQAPIVHSPCHGGFSLITRYQDIRAILRDASTFSSGRYPLDGRRLGGGVAIPPNGVRIGMIEMDPPEATMLRAVLAPWFTRRAVESARERIAQISCWLVDTVIERGVCDVVQDLARPMPLILIMDILGLPLERWSVYGQVLHKAVTKSRGSMAGLRWLAADLRGAVDGAAYVENGLLAALARAHVGGLPLGIDLVCELAMMLLFGGADTTIAAISHALLCLSGRRADRRRLIEDPERLGRAVEEILRLHSPSTGVARTVMAPAAIGGTEFRPGERVLCALGSGNRDESMFGDADTFDLDMPRRPHLAFGLGAHACLGQNLARTDLRLLLDEILRRMPDFEIDPEHAEPYSSIPLVSGYAAMPMRFTPSSPSTPRVADWPDLTAPRLQPAPDDAA